MADDTTQTTNSASIPVSTSTDAPVTTATPIDDKVGSKKPAGDQPNPLDVLEKLLDDIDPGKGGGTPSAKDLAKKGQADKPTGPTPEEIAEKELEEKRLEYEQRKEEQQVIDQQKIEEQRQTLVSEMETGEANVARAQQDEEKKQEKEEKKEAGDGFEVVQLDHTKI